MYRLADGLVRLMAPVLPFTADEMWRHMPGARSESVHLETFPDVEPLRNRELVDEWTRLLAVRDTVNAALEDKRKEKVIGTSLTASVRITASGALGTLLERHRADLPQLLIVSDLTLEVGLPSDADMLAVVVDKASGSKCERCWRYVLEVSAEDGRQGLCVRCVDALALATVASS